MVAADAGDSGSRKTHIMYGANLSYKLLVKYLDACIDCGLMCEGGSSYQITDKGEEFLQVYGDYDESRRDIEDQINHLNSGKETLENMLEG